MIPQALKPAWPSVQEQTDVCCFWLQEPVVCGWAQATQEQGWSEGALGLGIWGIEPSETSVPGPGFLVPLAFPVLRGGQTGGNGFYFWAFTCEWPAFS